MYLSFSLIEERALDLRLTHIWLGLIGISEKDNRFGRDIDTFRIEFAMLQDIPMEMSVNNGKKWAWSLIKALDVGHDVV